MFSLTFIQDAVEILKVAAADRAYLSPTAASAILPESLREELSLDAHAAANKEIGRGETEGNNRGADIRRYCHPNGDGYEWCSAFAGYCWLQACFNHQASMPFKRSLGARTLVKNMGAAGRLISIEEAKPGDLVCWPRPPVGSYHGHVGVFEALTLGIVHTIDGNSGPKVRLAMRDIRKEPPLLVATIRLP